LQEKIILFSCPKERPTEAPFGQFKINYFDKKLQRKLEIAPKKHLEEFLKS
jgi:hypothetical protein